MPPNIPPNTNHSTHFATLITGTTMSLFEHFVKNSLFSLSEGYLTKSTNMFPHYNLSLPSTQISSEKTYCINAKTQETDRCAIDPYESSCRHLHTSWGDQGAPCDIGISVLLVISENWRIFGCPKIDTTHIQRAWIWALWNLKERSFGQKILHVSLKQWPAAM